MDLDDEELKATRKLNGVDKESSIEEDIKNVKKYIELVINKDYCDCNELNVICGKHCDGSKNVAYSMQNILAERKKDKKRIKELEEENQKYIVQLTDEQYRNLVDIIRKESKKEFEQKVKDKIEDLKLSGGSNGKDNVENLARELVIEVLEELLEDK